MAVQTTLPVLKLPFLGSKNISDANLESFDTAIAPGNGVICIEVGTIFEEVA